jgi:hypothetical protein
VFDPVFPNTYLPLLAKRRDLSIWILKNGVISLVLVFIGVCISPMATLGGTIAVTLFIWIPTFLVLLCAMRPWNFRR